MMKIGTFTTLEGIELSLETSQLRELIEYLWRQQATEFLSGEQVDPADAPGIGPEDYERLIQAAWAVRQACAAVEQPDLSQPRLNES